MQTVTFKYFSGVLYSRSFYVLSIRGFDNPDEWQLEPQIQIYLSDFSLQSYFRGFRRIVTINCGVIQAHADRLFLEQFLQSNARSIVYGGIEQTFSLDNPTHYSVQWLNEFQYARSFEIRLIEDSIRTTWPSPIIEDNMTGYIISHVKIEQDETNPETFTTALGKLATDDTGTAIPSINLATYAPIIIVIEKQSALIMRPDTITQSGSNLAFKMGYSLAGNPSADGFFYADLCILLQAKP